MNLYEAAEIARHSFERRKRDDGEEFYCMKENAPAWLRRAFLSWGAIDTCDWDYLATMRIFAAMMDYSEEQIEEGDIETELCDRLVDIYNCDLVNWLNDSFVNAGYVDDAVSETGWDKERGIYGAIAMGQHMKLREMYCHYLAAIKKQLVEEVA